MPQRRFREHLRNPSRNVWEAIFAHPFIREVGDGSLAKTSFRYFLAQDYLYLQDFARVLMLTGAKAPEQDTLKMFAEHAAGAVEVEKALHRGLARRLGLTLKELESTPRSPATVAYTRHLLAVARGGSFAEAVAAVLPCYWVYWEGGKRLKRRLPSDPVYRDWITTYAAEQFGRLVQQQLRLVDELGATATPAEQERMKAIFLQSSRYEYLFWDAAYRLLEWPV